MTVKFDAREILAATGAKGGGRPDLAQGGMKCESKEELEAALEKGLDFIRQKLVDNC